MRRTVLLATLLLLASGCGEAPVAAVEATPDPTAPVEVRGVVVDDAIRPLGGVQVTLAEGDRTRTANTTADGRWNFTAVRPGAHFLSAAKVGFLEVRLNVQAAAGMDEVRIVLAQDAGYRKPYVQPFEFRGLIECGAVANAPPPVGHAAVALCDTPNQLTGARLTNDQFMVRHLLDGGAPPHVQSELVWDSTQPQGSSLLLYLDEVNRTEIESPEARYVNLASASGRSPVVVQVAGERLDRLGLGYDLQLRVFSWPDDPAPAGATVSQEFRIYSHAFYGFSPPPGWQFGKDGAPVVPPA
jgi:hypothetical protein